MSAEIAELWFKETRRICKLSKWCFRLRVLSFVAIVAGLISLGLSLGQIVVCDNKAAASSFAFAGFGFLTLGIILLYVEKRAVSFELKFAVAALDCIEGTAQTGWSGEKVKPGLFLSYNSQFIYVYDNALPANDPDLVWAFEKFGSGAKNHTDYKFPLEPEIKVEITRKYKRQPVNLTLTFTTRKITTDPGRLLMDFGPFNSTIGRQLETLLRKRVEELLPYDLEYLRLDGSLADKLALSATLRLPDSPDLTRQNSSKSAPYRVESAEISAALPFS